MDLLFLKSFSKDLDKLKDKKVKDDLLLIIEEMKLASVLSEIKNVKKLKGFKNYYRIRVGDHRLGFSYDDQTISFVRFLLRKDIYKFFP